MIITKNALWGLLLTAAGSEALQSVLKDTSTGVLGNTGLGRNGGDRVSGKGGNDGNGGGEKITVTEICGECVPREEILMPGVGLDLSVGYGTAAIRYHDKSAVDVEKLEGSEEYIELMKRLAPPYVHYGPPFDSIADQIRYDLEQAQRAIRKARGLPSTKDIETLSSFIAQLFALTSSTAEVPLGNKVVISTTLIPNLPPGDFDEALEFANLTRIISPKSTYAPLSQTNVGLAGMGYGICKYWANYADCQDEEVNSGVKALITIGFTNEELSIETAYAYTAYWVYPDIHVQYPTLGYNYTPHAPNYWTSVKERITTSLKATDMLPDTLLLLGESAGDKKFQDVVFEALGEMGVVWEARGMRDWTNILRGFEYGVQKEKPPLMLAARGAAEFAKRIQGEPKMCVEIGVITGFLGKMEYLAILLKGKPFTFNTIGCPARHMRKGDDPYSIYNRDRVELDGFEAEYERDPEKIYVVEYTY